MLAPNSGGQHEVCLRRESFVNICDFTMNFLVSPEVSALGKAAIAHFTFEWLLTSVPPYVYFQRT
jgi:hypothetical protein